MSKQSTLDNTEVVIKKGKFIETGNIGEEKQRKNKTQYPSNDQTKKNKTNKKHNMCWTPLYTNNVNKTLALLQTTGAKNEPSIVFMRKSQRTSQHGTFGKLLFKQMFVIRRHSIAEKSVIILVYMYM